MDFQTVSIVIGAALVVILQILSIAKQYNGAKYRATEQGKREGGLEEKLCNMREDIDDAFRKIRTVEERLQGKIEVVEKNHNDLLLQLTDIKSDLKHIKNAVDSIIGGTK
jgi:hypothetical protein